MTGIEARFRLQRPGFRLDIDFSLPEKGITAVFGPSGSGKTTLLRCIAGLERAATGRLVVNGECWQDARHWVPPHKRSLGYVFQEANLFPHLSVLGNLRYGIKRMNGPQRVSLDPAIELLGIGHLLDRMPDRLSGGERQRVGIARAVAVNPRLLLMDEPLAALDVKRKQEILPYLERLHDELHVPVLYVSHAPDEVARLADHLLALEEGHLIAAGPFCQTWARLNLPFCLDDEDAGVVIDGTVAEHDTAWNLLRIEFAGGSLWIPSTGLATGRRARVRVLARDVSLSHAQTDDTSILNAIPARLIELTDDAHPALARAKLGIGETLLIARLTKRSVDRLGLRPGQNVWAHVKAVALVG